MIDIVAVSLSVLSFVILLFLVLDRTCLCARFVRRLSEPGEKLWTDAVRAKCVPTGELPASPDCSRADNDWGDWLSVRLIASHTAPVAKFIYYPFAIFLIMFLSRHRIFDAWDWPPALIMVILFALGVATYAALQLRRSAQQVRRQIVERLRERVLVLRRIQQNTRAEKIERLMEDIKNETGGAFSRIGGNPIIRALLIPSTGLGGLVLLEYLVSGA